MYQRFLLVVLTLLLLTQPIPGKAEGTTMLPPPGVHQRRATSSAGSFPYRLFVPGDAVLLCEKGGTLPCVILLPDAKGKPADVGVRSAWGKRAEASGFVLIAPQTMEDVAAIWADAARHLPLDLNRVFVVGGTVQGIPAAAGALPGKTDKAPAGGNATYYGRLDPTPVWSFFEQHPRLTHSPVMTRLTVVVTNLKSGRGNALVALYDQAKGFPDANARASVSTPVANDQAEAVFDNLPPGHYAAVVLHDENKNAKMDFTLGIPREGFGATNGASARFSAPKWEAAKFYIAGEHPVRRVARVLYLGR